MGNIEVPSFVKTSTEEYAIGFDFTDRLPTGQAPASATVSATNTGDDTVDNTVLDTTTATVASNIVTAGVKDGVNGENYRITFLVTLDGASADILAESIDMTIEDPV